MADMGGHCRLHHRGFLTMGDIVFQRSDMDGAPVVLVPLGGHSVAIPLRALQRELCIGDDSDDGRMLALIVEALDYVVTLRPGDALPAEILSGEASWTPAAHHVAAARRAVRVAALRQTADLCRSAPGSPADLAADELAAACAALAPLTGLPGATEVASAMERLAGELAFIESGRERLLERVRHLTTLLHRVRLDSVPRARHDELIQSRRLAATAVRRIAARFADVEARTSNIVPALRGGVGMRQYIRSNRDWMHRSRLAWEPILLEWERERGARAKPRRLLITPTYRFLAPRFMSVHEWRTEGRLAGGRMPASQEW